MSVLQNAKVQSARVMAENQVIFTLNLNDNPELRSPQVVHTALVGFMMAYPNVQSFQTQHDGDLLHIAVWGSINPDIFTNYAPKE